MYKKRIVFVITDDLYVRNYIKSDALKALRSEHECKFVVAKNVTHLDAFEQGSIVGRYGVDPLMARRHYLMLELLTWRHRAKSKTFRFRIRRFDAVLMEPLFRAKMTGKILAVMRMVKNWGRRVIFGNTGVFPIWFKYMQSTLKTCEELDDAIVSARPDLVVFPCAAYNAEGNDIVNICRKNRIPSLFLVDNWDNLSSKSILWAKPDSIAVWGNQAKEHAVDIQGFNVEQVSCIGTPRFDKYFSCRNEDLKPHFAFKYILFVGTALAFDEAGALKHLNEIIERNPNTFSGVKIVYRPHPWRLGKDSILAMNLANVVVDPQMLDWYSQGKYSTSFQPDIDYYPSLLKNTQFMIGGPTSMLVEAMIFYKRFLALVYPEENNLTDPANVYRNYTHFEGLDNVSVLSFCNHIDDLERNFIQAWDSRTNVDKVLIDSERAYYCFNDTRAYSSSLLDLCESVINSDRIAERAALY